MPTKPSDWNQVDQASLESFPASDPPAWGSSHAAASESTVCPPSLLPSRMSWGKRIAYAAGGLAALALVAESVRRLRR